MWLEMPFLPMLLLWVEWVLLIQVLLMLRLLLWVSLGDVAVGAVAMRAAVFMLP